MQKYNKVVLQAELIQKDNAKEVAERESLEKSIVEQVEFVTKKVHAGVDGMWKKWNTL